MKNREPLLASEAAIRLMQDEIAVLPKEFGVVIHGFAFMPNHFHLMVESRQGRLPDAMQAFLSRSVKKLNARFGWDGPLFRARYNNRVVEDEAYWRHLLAYLHLNPVRAGLAAAATAARTTSHLAYLGVERIPWLETAELLELYGGRWNLAAYVDEVAAGNERGPDGFDANELFDAPDTFVLPVVPFQQRDLGAAERDVRAVAGPHPQRKLAPDLRDLAMWWAVMGGASRAEIGRDTRLSAQHVGRCVRRIEKTADPRLAAWRDALLMG
ncbi:MAG: transposase [Alphaproteobacteria bacterium]|nr:transposase [Alphaproteobacteria bacterium]